MQHFDSVNISKTVIHKVGNKSKDEGTTLSNQILSVEAQMEDLLIHYFLSPFKEEEYFRLHHPSELGMNEVWQYATQIFEDPKQFIAVSKHIASHLYEQSVHPKIKTGELYIVLFEDCLVDDELTNAIGIFKSENKDRFIKVYTSEASCGVDSDEGININKLDKGCIIFNTEREEGYLALAVDNSGRGDAARFWKEDFLSIQPRQDSFHFTQDILKVTSDYVKERLPEEFETEEKDKIGLMKRSLDYFYGNEVCDIEEFKAEVFDTPELKESFTQYTEEKTAQENIHIPAQFEIADTALKKSKKFFKSTIKLDKNFHVYVHGNPERMEKGFDDGQNLQYYKLYFEEEL